MGNLSGQEQKSVVHTAPQVYWATHDSKGSLPYYQRSFISFSFGGKAIEDFDLIAYCNGDYMERQGSAEFEDLTSSYDILDGETYHGTHFKPFQLSLTLATDGMTQQQLEKFKAWFRGGITRRLILAEHPNRYICARLQSPPQLHLIPFEMPFNMPIGIKNKKISYDTVSNLYKGTIDITFVSSDPFWQAIDHIMGSWDANNNFQLKWNDIPWESESEDYEIREAQTSVAKIVYEDNIPLPTMVTGDVRMAFGETGVEVKNGKRRDMTLETSSSVIKRSLTKGNTRDAEPEESNDMIVHQGTDEYEVIVVEKFHRPISLPSDSEIFQRYDTIVAGPISEISGEEIEIADSSVTGEFMWWTPWNYDDTFDKDLTGDTFINQYDREFVAYRGARVLPDDLSELIINDYTVRSGTAGSNIVDAYDYPQVLGEELEDTEFDIISGEEEEKEEDDGNREVIVTRGLTKAGENNSKDGKTLPSSVHYFFYGGTAPSPATISFKLPLKFTSNNGLESVDTIPTDYRYIKSIANSYCKTKVRIDDKEVSKSYSTIKVNGQYEKEISMTTPNIMTSYNKVIYIIKEVAAGMNVVDLQEKIRDEIRHPYVRAYALTSLQKLIDFENEASRYNGEYSVIPTNKNGGLPHRRLWANMMNSFWVNNDGSKLINIIIDSKTSKATGTFMFRTNPNFNIIEGKGDWLYFTLTSKTVTRTEDIGDAMRSTWYYIDDRNEFEPQIEPSTGEVTGYVVSKWENTVKGRSYSHKVTSDFPVPLRHFSIDYEYLYL